MTGKGWQGKPKGATAWRAGDNSRRRQLQNLDLQFRAVMKVCPGGCAEVREEVRTSKYMEQ